MVLLLKDLSRTRWQLICEESLVGAAEIYQGQAMIIKPGTTLSVIRPMALQCPMSYWSHRSQTVSGNLIIALVSLKSRLCILFSKVSIERGNLFIYLNFGKFSNSLVFERRSNVIARCHLSPLNDCWSDYSGQYLYKQSSNYTCLCCSRPGL